MFDFGRFFINKVVVELCSQTCRGESVGNRVKSQILWFYVSLSPLACHLLLPFNKLEEVPCLARNVEKNYNVVKSLDKSLGQLTCFPQTILSSVTAYRGYRVRRNMAAIIRRQRRAKEKQSKSSHFSMSRQSISSKMAPAWKGLTQPLGKRTYGLSRKRSYGLSRKRSYGLSRNILMGPLRTSSHSDKRKV